MEREIEIPTCQNFVVILCGRYSLSDLSFTLPSADWLLLLCASRLLALCIVFSLDAWLSLSLLLAECSSKLCIRSRLLIVFCCHTALPFIVCFSPLCYL